MGSNLHLWKMSCISTKPWIAFRSVYSSRHLCTSPLTFAKEKVDEVPAASIDVLEDLREPKLSEEDIIKKRFKARLPERDYKKFVLKEPVPIEAKYDFAMHRLRRYYGRFGQDSKLNPGICWPTREEILETMKLDEEFEPTLQERIQKAESKRLAEEQRKREVEEEVDKNMANLDKWIAEYHGKIDKKNSKAKELKLEREKLVEEISEYLGYDIDPRDPRFKEAVEQKNKEKKKALKVKKQQESYDKMLDKLRKVAQTK